jgi:amino acid transporter
VGIALFFALALSVPFYILGFCEAVVSSFPSLSPHFLKITITTAIILFTIAYYGAGIAIKVQYFIMAFLFLAIFSFLGGGVVQFSYDRFLTNLDPGYTIHSVTNSTYNFWVIFAIYFPAVTGIDAGVNMSGDLEDPGHSIPKGTLAAVAIGFLVYLLQILIGAGAWDRAELINNPYGLLKDNALFGFSWIVVCGVIAATLSSALSSYLGAPRVLQAISRDRILKLLMPFAKGAKKGDEPRKALWLTFAVTLIVLFWAGNGTGGKALNGIAAIITMFFLYSYGMINLSAFIEDFGDNPSFRPQFKFYHWSTAIIGALACVVVSILINWQASLAAIFIISIFLWHIKTKHLKAAFGDARRGFVYNAIRRNLLRLDHMPEHSKNWRPTVIAFSGSAATHEPLVRYATWIAAKRGLVYLAHVLEGEFTELAPRRPGAIQGLKNFCREKQIDAFPTVVTASSLEKGISMLLQAVETGPIRPNVAILGWTTNYNYLPAYIDQLRTASILGINILLFSLKGLPLPQIKKRIDIWWRGKKNGELMILSAHLLTENWEWEHTKIRLLRVIENEEGREPAQKALDEMLEMARVEATSEVIVSSEQFENIFKHHSSTADCILLGFELPEAGDERKWHGFYQKLLNDMPTTILVNSQSSELLEV